MNLEKNIELAMLSDFYFPLLTKKQQYIFSLYYFKDVSLSEIAQCLKITRQAVLDTLKKSEKSLKNFEEKLGLLKKYLQFKNEIENIGNKDLEKLLKIWEG